MLPPAERAPPPSTLPQVTPVAACQVAVVAVALAATLVTTRDWKSAIGVSVAALVAVLVSLAVLAFARRVPERVGRRCVLAAAVVGGGLGGLLLLSFIVLLTTGSNDPGTNDGIGVVIAGVVGGILGGIGFSAMFGVLLGLISTSLLGVADEPARDTADEVLLRTGAWLTGAGGVAMGGAMGFGTIRVVLGLAMLAAGVGATAEVLARDRVRARWLARVVAGAEPGWSVTAIAVADGEPPLYVGIDRDACDAALVRRSGSETAPFRTSGTIKPVALVDVGARRVLGRIRRRSIAATGSLLLAAALLALALRAV